jgi:hypothetical protein
MYHPSLHKFSMSKSPAAFPKPGAYTSTSGHWVTIGWRRVWVPAQTRPTYSQPASQRSVSFGAAIHHPLNAQQALTAQELAVLNMSVRALVQSQVHRTATLTPPASFPVAVHQRHQKLISQSHAPRPLYFVPDPSSVDSQLFETIFDLAAGAWDKIPAQQQRLVVIMAVMVAAHLVAPGVGHVVAAPFAKGHALHNELLHHATESIISNKVVHGVHTQVLKYEFKEPLGTLSGARANALFDDTQNGLLGWRGIAVNPNLDSSPFVQAAVAFVGSAVGLPELAQSFADGLLDTIAVGVVGAQVQTGHRRVEPG